MMSIEPITAVSDFLTTTINKIFPDANQKAQAIAALETLKENDDFQIQIAQLKINLADAQGNWFQSSWRPALAWSCVISFIYHFLLFNFLVLIFPTLRDITPQDVAIMMGVLTILIGARSLDKGKGVDSK